MRCLQNLKKGSIDTNERIFNTDYIYNNSSRDWIVCGIFDDVRRGYESS